MPSTPTLIPPTLYRYESYSLQTLENLKNRTIYFSHPSKFNDPFDRGMPLVLDSPTDKVANKLRAKLGVAPSTPVPQIKRKIQDFADSTFKSVGEFGLVCFTETNDNLLMWSHYASHGR
ncbi:MAG TPA: hypothetical protein VGM98_12215, partial [Schlesneria sp.]